MPGEGSGVCEAVLGLAGTVGDAEVGDSGEALGSTPAGAVLTITCGSLDLPGVGSALAAPICGRACDGETLAGADAEEEAGATMMAPSPCTAAFALMSTWLREAISGLFTCSVQLDTAATRAKARNALMETPFSPGARWP